MYIPVIIKFGDFSRSRYVVNASKTGRKILLASDSCNNDRKNNAGDEKISNYFLAFFNFDYQPSSSMILNLYRV